MVNRPPEIDENTTPNPVGDDSDILSIEEFELPARPLVVGAQGQGSSRRQYELIAGIAKGGMGEIFLANMSQPNAPIQQVIVKRLLAELRNNSDQLAMFRAEAEVMHRLNHPSIVAIIDDPIIDDTPCLAMEYIRGRNIDQVLSKSVEDKKPVSVDAMLYIMTEALRGLHHVHNATLENGEPLRLVHRDITPGNLILSFDGDVKITDFGISKSQMSRISTTVGIVKGKARYLSPEQIIGEPATIHSDLFACACVCVEIVTGRPLFDAPNVHKTLHSIVNEERMKISDLIGVREPSLIAAIEKALCKDPRKRYKSALDFCQALEESRKALKSRFGRNELSQFITELFADAPEPWETSSRAQSQSDQDTTFPQVHSASSVLPKDEKRMSELSRSEQATPAPQKIRRKLIPEDQPSPQRKQKPFSTPKNTPSKTSHEQDEEDTKISLALNQTSYQEESSHGNESLRRPPLPLATPVTNSFETVFKFKNTWPIFFATFGLGLVTGVITTLIVIDDDQAERQTHLVEPKAITLAPKPDTLSEPPRTEPSQIKPLVAPILVAPTKLETSGSSPTKTRPPKAIKQTGFLSVYGPKGARISINGKRLRKRVPLVAYSLKTGKYRIQISKGRYRRSASATVKPDKTSVIKFKKRKRPKKR